MPEGKEWVTIKLHPDLAEKVTKLFATHGTKSAFINSCFSQAILFIEQQEARKWAHHYLNATDGLRKELGTQLIKDMLENGRVKK